MYNSIVYHLQTSFFTDFIYFLQKTFVALSCLLAVAVASPAGYYRYASPYYVGGYSYGAPVAYAAGTPVTYGAPQGYATYAAPAEAASNAFLGGFTGQTDITGPLSADSAALIKAGAPRLAQASAKLNELAKQLPATLANIDPNTKGDIAKVNGIVNDICAKAMAEIKPTEYTKNYTPQGLQEMCAYISKIGGDILGGLDNPAIFQKYTADLQGAIAALNGKAADLTL